MNCTRDTRKGPRGLRVWILAVLLGAGVSAAQTPYDGPPRTGFGGRADMVTDVDESPAAKRARVRLELAAAYFGQGQLTTALDEVKRALVADPDNVGAYNMRGLIYAALGEPVMAEDSFRDALRLRGDDADTLHNYGWFLCQRERHAEARQRFAAVLKQPRFQNSAKTWLAQGICEARAGDGERAERHLMRSYEIDPGNVATALNLSALLLSRGDLERALFYVQRAHQQPEAANAESLWLAARIQHRRGDRAALADLGEQLRRRFPGSREATAFEQGKFDE